MTGGSASIRIYRQREYVTDPAFRLDHTRGAQIDVQSSSQPQNLNIDTSVEYVVVNVSGLQQKFAGKGALGRVHKSNQQRLLALAQRNLFATRIDEPPPAPIKLPT